MCINIHRNAYTPDINLAIPTALVYAPIEELLKKVLSAGSLTADIVVQNANGEVRLIKG